MSLSDTQLGGVAAGAAVLLAIAVLAIFLRTRDTRGKVGTDSWERNEGRRQRKEMVYGIASYALLFCCAAVAAALSFHGLVGFGRENLNLSGGWEYLVPFGLDGAAMFCSVLAVREASHGDAALGSRMLVWLFAAASAWFNWVHAPRGGGHDGAPQFFSGMSLSAAVLFDRALKQTRRAALREQGLVPRPLPQIRMVRWARAPRETYAAWSLMLLENVRTLDEAVDEVRDERRERLASKERRRQASRRERAEIRAISGRQSGWTRTRGGRRSDVPALHSAGVSGGYEPVGQEPAIAVGSGSGGSRPLPRGAERPAQQQSQRHLEPQTIDLTAEDDTLTLPRLSSLDSLDSLEQKLKALERQFG
jgi:hypothetical protein